MDQLFIDTGAWFAFVNRKDPDHKPVRKQLRSFTGRLITSNFIFDEIVTLCLCRLGHDAANKVGHTLRDSAIVDLVRVTADDEQNAWELFIDRGDKQYSFTDCTSFVLMRRLKLQQALALDADFQREGFAVLP